MARAGTTRIQIPARARPATDPILARELGQRLCAIFALDANRTTGITIALDTTDAARVIVEQFITRGQADELVELATTYGLHRADPPRQLSPGFIIRDLR